MLVRVCPCVHNWRRDLWEGKRERRDLWEHQLTATGVGRQQSTERPGVGEESLGATLSSALRNSRCLGSGGSWGAFRSGCDGHGHVLI